MILLGFPRLGGAVMSRMIPEEGPLALRHLMGTISIQDPREKPTDTGWWTNAKIHTQRRTLSRYVSVPVLSHSVFNISAVSIIDRWISPLRCTKNHSDISLLELRHQYFTGWLFVERLKGWRRAALCSVSLSFCTVLWKWKTYFSVCIPVLKTFFSCALILGSVWYICCSLSLFPSTLLFPFSVLPSPLRFSLHSPCPSFLFLFDCLTSI